MLINMKYCFNQSPFVSLIDDYQLSLHVHTCISLNYPPSLSSTDLLAFISIDLRKYLHMAWEYCSAVLYIWFRRMFIYTCTSEQFSTHGNDFLLILMCYTGFSPWYFWGLASEHGFGRACDHINQFGYHIKELMLSKALGGLLYWKGLGRTLQLYCMAGYLPCTHAQG